MPSAYAQRAPRSYQAHGRVLSAFPAVRSRKVNSVRKSVTEHVTERVAKSATTLVTKNYTDTFLLPKVVPNVLTKMLPKVLPNMLRKALPTVLQTYDQKTLPRGFLKKVTNHVTNSNTKNVTKSVSPALGIEGHKTSHCRRTILHFLPPSAVGASRCDYLLQKRFRKHYGKYHKWCYRNRCLNMLPKVLPISVT